MNKILSTMAALMLAMAAQAADDFVFTSSGPNIAAPPQPALDLTNEVTLEAWLMPGTTLGRVLDKGTPGTSDAYMLDLYPGNALRFITAKGALSYPANLPTTQWSHVAGVYSATGQVMALYLNGVQVASITNGSWPAMTTTTSPLQVGADPALGNRYVGRMLRLAVYSRALAPAEIAQRASSPLTNIVSLAGAVGEWVATNQTGNLFPSIGSGTVPLTTVVPDAYPPSTIPIGQESTNASRYNVTWYSASTTGSKGSVPLGNGDIALNAWVEAGGDLVFYISKTDSWDDAGRLCKLGRVRVRFTPNPFTLYSSFEQTLDVQRGELRVTAGPTNAPVKVKLWVDANQPVVHVETVNTATGRVEVVLENLRPTLRTVTAAYSEINYGRSGVPTYSYPDTIATGAATNIVWYHHNTNSSWNDAMVLQQITNAAALGFVDPYLNRVFGGWIEGAGFTNASPASLLNPSASGTNSLAIHILTETNSSPAAWKAHLQNNRNAAAAIPLSTAYASHLDWWTQYWQRSWIHAGSADSTQSNSSWRAAFGYALQRYINACAGRGAFPIKFNGSLFTVEYNGDPDYRKWGPAYWMQNTRLPYWSMLAAGDFDQMRPLFKLYSDTLDVRRRITANWFGHAGSYIPEVINIHGLAENGTYGWDVARNATNGSYRVNGWVNYDYVPLIELGWMMFDYADYSGDTNIIAQQALPMIDDGVHFYHEHFKVRRDANDYPLGTNEVYQANGQYIMYPNNSCETWWACTNATPDAAGWRVLMSRLLALDPALTTPEQRAYWLNFNSRLPDVPMRNVTGGLALGYAQTPGKYNNSEAPELYPVFPFRMYGLGKPDLDVALRTYANRSPKASGGWQQDAIFAALLGQTSDAASYIVQNFTTRDASMRFPAFWGPNFDWTPDQDHGTVAQIALQRMLAQWDGGTVRLLPAWPQAWDVDFQLHGPGGATVHCVYTNGALQTLELSPTNLSVVLPPWLMVGTSTNAVWTGANDASWGTAANWLSGPPVPGGNVTFDYHSTGQRATTLAGNTTLGQLIVTDAPGEISIANNTLTLTNGVNMAAARANLTLSSATTLAAPQTWSVPAGRTLTVSGAMAGAVSLTKGGEGTLTLSGANTRSGSTTISEGTLRLQGAAFSTMASTYSIAYGAVLNLDGATSVATGTTYLNGAGTLRLSGGTLANNTGSGRNIALSLGAGAQIDIQAGATLQNGGWQNINWANNLAGLNVDGTLDVWDGSTVRVDALTGSGTVNKSHGTANTINLTVGVNNGSGVFNGSFANTSGVGPISLTKVGTGTQTLSAAATYSGPTTVGGGTLLVNGSLAAGSAVTVQSGATFGGSGTVNGPTTISAGGTLAPGANGLGTLTISNTLALAGATRMELSQQALAVTNDLVRCSGLVTFGGSLLLTNVGTNALVAGTRFTLFSAPLRSGAFNSIAWPPLSPGLGWTNKLLLNGSIEVVQVVNTTPINLTFSVSNGQMTLAWPPDHTGWRLLTQTLGLGTNWFPVPGSATTNQVTFPLDPNNPAVFYRLVFP